MATMTFTSEVDASGNANIYRLDSAIETAVILGKTGYGVDFKAWSNTAGDYFIWDASIKSLQFYDAEIEIGKRTFPATNVGVDLTSCYTGLRVCTETLSTGTGILANTTDYVGMAAMFQCTINKAVTLGVGGGYSWAGIWSTLEVEKNIDSTGSGSAVWGLLESDEAITITTSAGPTTDWNAGKFTVWFTSTSAVLSGSAKIFGVRIDSSVIDGANFSAGVFNALQIDKNSGAKDWQVGIDINNATKGIDIGACTTGIDFTGALATQGINFDDSTLTITNNMGRSHCYIGIGTYNDHLSLDLSTAATSGDRLYATQLFIDSTANPGHAAHYLQGAYYRMGVTTVDQANLSIGVMCPTLDVDFDVKNAYALKAELDMSAAGISIGQNAFAISGYLEVATSGALDVSGSLGTAAVIGGFAGGTGLTLTGSSRTFAMMAHTYATATATATMLINAGGTVTDSALLVDEYQVVSCPIGIHISAGLKGLVIDHNTTTAIGIGSTQLTNVIDFTGVSVSAVMEDNLAAPNKAGSIAILTPAGAVAYINYYDGTRA